MTEKEVEDAGVLAFAFAFAFCPCLSFSTLVIENPVPFLCLLFTKRTPLDSCFRRNDRKSNRESSVFFVFSLQREQLWIPAFAGMTDKEIGDPESSGFSPLTPALSHDGERVNRE